MSTAPAPQTVTLKIDGRSVTVPKGTNVLEAALKLGIDISYFCYHPGLSAPAVCRQCLVEIVGQPKLAPSCYTPVGESMEVLTQSEKVLVARQQMLEFTLVNHPVDCPICDKAGECTLQKLYFDWDHKASRVDVNKISKNKVVDIGPHIVLDQERCILCTRCIRVCDEVARKNQLTMAARGDREVLTTAPGERLDNPYSINTVDVCPVGALTAKDFRFTMRAWELEMVPSICTGCATGCNDEIQFGAQKIWRLYPRHNPDVNQYWMCDEGRFTYKEIHERRMGTPVVAGMPASWSRALEEAAGRLRAPLKNDGARVGIVLSAQATNEDNYVAAKLASALGIERIYGAGRAPRPERADKILRSADVNPNSAGVQAVAGGRLKSQGELSIDIERGDLRALIVMGEDVVLSKAASEKIGSLDALIVLACHDGDVVARAHVALPAAAWAEVHGTMTNAKGMVQRLNAALPAPGDAKPHWEILGELGAKLEAAGVEFPDVRAVHREMVTNVAAFAGAQWGHMALPIQLRFAGSRG